MVIIILMIISIMIMIMAIAITPIIIGIIITIIILLYIDRTLLRFSLTLTRVDGIILNQYKLSLIKP